MITSDRERLQLLADTLGDAAAGRVRLPVISHADAADLAMAMHAELDAAIDARTTDAAAAGHHIACRAGCSACCTSPLLVTEGEAVAVAAWLEDHPDERAAFVAAYPAWKRAIGDVGAALSRATTDAERRAAGKAAMQRAAMCAFNRDGLCTIYDARPARCRRVHALDTDAACRADSDGQARYFEHARTEATFAQHEPLRDALHQSLRGHGKLELLCAAVARLLHGKVARNEPCPCGSGKKHKQCCAA